MGKGLMRCSQRCSQRALVLKTETPQVVDLRRHVELEGIEPSTSSMPWGGQRGRVELDQFEPGAKEVFESRLPVDHDQMGSGL